MLTPVITGEGLKVKVMLRSPGPNVAESAGVPLTVKSVGWTVSSLTASDRLITNWTGAVPVTRLPQAGWWWSRKNRPAPCQ